MDSLSPGGDLDIVETYEPHDVATNTVPQLLSLSVDLTGAGPRALGHESGEPNAWLCDCRRHQLDKGLLRLNPHPAANIIDGDHFRQR